MPIGREVRRYEDIRNYLYRPGPLAAIKRIVHAEQEAVLIPRFIYDLWNRTEPRRGRGQIPALAAKLCETVAWNSLVEPYSLHQAFGHVRAGIQTRLSSVCIASDIRTADGVILDEPRRIVIVSVLTGDGLSNEWRAIAAYERNGTIEARMLPRRITYGEIEQHIQNNSPHNVLPPRIELPYLDGEGRISMVQLVAESQEPLQPDQLASPRILEMAA
ncbi:MAG: hypothetical protein LBR78_03445, partial [Holosporales bacterium]|nr:hypothetical protein [Holosporales bacterium]